MNRAMRRKAAREKMPAGPVSGWTLQEISKATGAKVDTLIEWLEAHSQELAEDMGRQMADMLYDGEGYIAATNILITLYAVKATFGELKTVQKGMSRLIKNFGPALDHIYDVGPKQAYEDIMSEYDLGELEFEDFDVEKLFENSQRAKFAAARVVEKATGKTVTVEVDDNEV